MKKVLFTSHVANFVKFNKPFMKWFQEQGWEVHYASLDEEEIPYCDQHFKVDFNRSPYSFDNVRAYFQLKKILKREHYDLIHCHTPMGGVVTRLAAKSFRKKGTKVLYTAHGFHFYKGAPKRNWLLYYNMERFLARYTDCIITMNEEDYQAASAPKFGAKCVKKINGVGVDLSRFHPVSAEEKSALRKEYGFQDEDFILIYVAEFTENKNHMFLLGLVKELLKTIPTLKVIFAGCGDTMKQCQSYVEQEKIESVVFFLGYRRDVEVLYRISDVSISVSKREGLPVNVIEAMASGLPVVCSEVRGQVDLVEEGENGFLFPLEAYSITSELVGGIRQLFQDSALRSTMRKVNIEKAQKYSLEQAIASMVGIYREFL